MPHNIGFVSTRFAGTDGVSLESSKWAHVLWKDKHVSYWYSGLSDRDPSVSHVVPEAYFGYPENNWINERIWGHSHRSRLVTDRIRKVANYLKSTLYDFVERYKIDILVPQNALTIPMHIPLGVAITEFLAETGMPAIAHHHDFYWERTRFSIGSADDYLRMAFPSTLKNIRHAVINAQAQEQLGLRTGASSLVVPNVFDFEKEPPQPDEYTKNLRKDIGLKKDDVLILQPTRIVPRKGIEHAIKLVGMLDDSRYKLVISHAAGDEGVEYKHMLDEMAREEGVDMRYIHERIGEVRQITPDGKKIYTLWDLYPFADFVTYPSLYEGFGNALLEAFYFRVPVLINRYSIFIQDIEPKGFRLPLMDGILTKKTVRETRKILEDNDYRKEIVDHNYEVAKHHYSYSVLGRSLRTLMTSLTGLD